MKKGSRKTTDELRPEYKRSNFGTLVGGKYAARVSEASNIVVLEPQVARAFHNDRFPDLKADYILANPPFNVSDWCGETLLIDAPGSGQWLTKCTGNLPTNT